MGPSPRTSGGHAKEPCTKTSVSSSPPSVKGHGWTYSMSKVSDSHRQVCLLVGCLARCLWISSHQHRDLEPPQQRSDRQASGTATVSSRNRSWGFPSSLRPGWLRPGADGQDSEPVFLPSSLFPLLLSHPLAKKKTPGTTGETAAGTGSREHPDPTNAMFSGDREPATGPGRGASCEKAVRNDVRHKNRGN